MNVHLTPKLETLIRSKVESGLYTSASEVVREALRLLEERDHVRQLRRDELRQAIRQGRDELDQGLSTSLDMQAIKQEARRRWEARQNEID